MTVPAIDGAEAYEVFARSYAGGDLSHVGVVFAANAALAAAYARWLYDEEAWTEMRIARRGDLVPVESRRHKAARGRAS